MRNFFELVVVVFVNVVQHKPDGTGRCLDIGTDDVIGQFGVAFPERIAALVESVSAVAER